MINRLIDIAFYALIIPALVDGELYAWVFFALYVLTISLYITIEKNKSLINFWLFMATFVPFILGFKMLALAIFLYNLQTFFFNSYDTK